MLGDAHRAMDAASDVLQINVQAALSSSPFVSGVRSLLRRMTARVGPLRVLQRYTKLFWRGVLALARWLNYMFAPAMVITLAKRNIQAFVSFYLLFVLYRSVRGYAKRVHHAIRERIALALGSGHYRRLRLLKDQLRSAKTYAQWKVYADEIDVLKGNNVWKEDPVSVLYDYPRITRMLADVRALTEMKDVPGIMSYMRSRLLRNIGGTGHKRLFAHLRAGTKRLIEEFKDEVVRSLYMVAMAPPTKQMTCRQKLAFFNETRHSLGRTALMLSGGASFGVYHVGVIKALHDNNMLPKVVSGASAGSIIAAWIGCMTEDELDHMLDPDRINLELFPPISGAVYRKIIRLYNTGVLFDIRTLARCLRANIGDITFAEAYARSGRVTNIVVAPTNSSKEVPRLLNYLTSPDVVIWSAAAASSAIPFFYESVELQMKDSAGKIVPYYTRGVRWSDGSFHSDLPMKRLAELFNVNSYIVSQVNPHVIPFAVRKEWRVNSMGGLLVQICNYCGAQLRHLIMLLFTNIGHLLPIVRRITIIPAAFNQKFAGDVTILPTFRISDYLNVVVNPTFNRLQDCARITEVLTWRKMAEIKNSAEIEVALDACVRIMRGQIMLSNEVTIEEGANLLGNRLASWAPDQFEMAASQTAAANAPVHPHFGLSTPPPRNGTEEPHFSFRQVPLRSGSAGSGIGLGIAQRHIGLLSHQLSAADLNALSLPANHDTSEDLSDNFIL